VPDPNPQVNGPDSSLAPRLVAGLRIPVAVGREGRMRRADFVQGAFNESDEWAQVSAVADSLTTDLRSNRLAAAIAAANQPGNSSALVQAVFLQEAAALGFRDESRGLFASYQSALRPDYYLPIGRTGIILEVERGKTTINNMDLLDFWKCHICEHADYLFLMVPAELRQNETMAPRREFATVARRLESFFRPGNETNVRGLVLLGY
jgi:hypothetical protein